MKKYLSEEFLGPHLYKHRAFLGLFLVNFFFYLVTVAYPGFLDAFALRSVDWTPLPNLHGLITLLTCTFLHGGFDHIFFNFLFALPFAVYLERKVGSKEFLKIWLLSGIGGSLLFVLTPSLLGWDGCVGSSGSIFGIMTACLILMDEHKILKILALALLTILVLPEYQMSVVGFLLPMSTAHSAHFGSFLTAALLCGHRKK